MLYITDIKTSDAGDYRCQGNAGGLIVSKRVTLTIYKEITFDEAPLEQHPVIYKDAIIKCRVSGNPTPTVSWRKDGKTLNPADDRYMMDEIGLHIKHITPADEGLYICRANVMSTGSMKNRKISVKVFIPPTFTVLPQDASAVKGQDVLIACSGTGKPLPSYQWYKGVNTRPLTGDRYFVSEEGTLTIKQTNVDDGGDYKCEVANPAGSVDQTATLTIVVPPSIVEIERYPQIKIGNDITLTCRADGNPVPSLRWRKEVWKENKFIDFVDGVQPDDGHIEVITDPDEPGTSKISIKQAEIADAGSYLCVGENEGGKTQGNATLTVEFAPIFNYPEVPFNYSWINHAANLTCKVLGEPAPHITWYTTKGQHPYFTWNEIENLQGHYKIQGKMRRSNLEIIARADDDFREYKCNATNKYGMSSQPLLLKRAYPPGPPQVEYVDVTPTMVEVRFNLPPDSQLPIIGFVGQYKDHGANWKTGLGGEEIWQLGGNNLDDRYKIENLQPRKRYTFRFAAQNEVGVGDWSVDRDETLPEVRVPYQPDIISSDKSSYPNAYRLRWKVPADGGKHILNYGIRYRQLFFEGSKLVGRGDYYPQYAQTGRTEKDEKLNLYWKVSADGERTTYEIRKLQSNGRYEIELYARNERGISEKNSIVFETGQMPAPGFVGKGSSRRPNLSLPLQLLVPASLILYLCKLCR